MFYKGTLNGKLLIINPVLYHKLFLIHIVYTNVHHSVPYFQQQQQNN